MSSGRAFDVRNKRTPIAVIRLRDRRLSCFTPAQWDEWLKEEWRRALGNGADRLSMLRGNFPCPCLDCTKTYQTQMEEQGRCCPPDPESAPKSSPKVVA